MLNTEQVKNTIFDLVDFTYEGEIKVEQCDGIKVEGDRNSVVIGCSGKSELARAFFLLAKELSEGKEYVSIRQKANFEDLGVMLSLTSTVMHKDAFKKYIDYMAALGLNFVYMYMEDSYELPDYPHFGYMRGRYTQADLKELDDYAYSMGVELIPCIQTLAHMQGYLRWTEASPIKDTAEVLLVDEEKTYEFIEYVIKTLSGTFRTKRFHVGMDEARTMGRGKYVNIHGSYDRKQMYIRHIGRVKEICSKYDITPIIWSDMIFRVCGGYTDEYAPEAVITDDVKAAVKDLHLSYWDYYREDKSQYDSLIERHQALSKNTSFAGAVWTWDGYLPNFQYTINTTRPALKSALEHGITSVCATMWGAGAQGTSDFFALPGLAVFSEICYRGDDVTDDEIYSVSEFLTGADRRFCEAVSEFFLGYPGATKMGGRFIACDILYALFLHPIDYKEAAERFEKALAVLREYDGEFAEFATIAMDIAARKARIMHTLRPAYDSGDAATIKQIAESLPHLVTMYEKMYQLNFEWYNDIYRPFGCERIQIHYTTIMERLKYAHKVLTDYLDGVIDTIPELDEKALNDEYHTWLPYTRHLTL